VAFARRIIDDIIRKRKELPGSYCALASGWGTIGLPHYIKGIRLWGIESSIVKTSPASPAD
jgi:hypothetical protein